VLLDLRKQETRDFLVEVDQRRRDRRDNQIRMVSVGLGMVIVIACWFIPGYWYARGRLYPGLPLLADQWIFMTLIGLGLTKLLPLKFGVRPRFDFIDGAGNLRPPQ